MSKFRGRNKRWNKKTRKARWKTYKKELIATGQWSEISENTLVTKTSAVDYPEYTPTHLGGKVEKGGKFNLTASGRDLPRRSEMNKYKKNAKRMKMTVRQYMFGECHNF